MSTAGGWKDANNPAGSLHGELKAPSSHCACLGALSLGRCGIVLQAMMDQLVDAQVQMRHTEMLTRTNRELQARPRELQARPTGPRHVRDSYVGWQRRVDGAADETKGLREVACVLSALRSALHWCCRPITSSPWSWREPAPSCSSCMRHRAHWGGCVYLYEAGSVCWGLPAGAGLARRGPGAPRGTVLWLGAGRSLWSASSASRC